MPAWPMKQYMRTLRCQHNQGADMLGPEFGAFINHGATNAWAEIASGTWI
jgi:hypothetical protein